jgi:isocitrate dehydrogenase
LIGTDCFVFSPDTLPDDLATKVKEAGLAGLNLKMITNRGIKVWPGGFPETFCTDHWRCRFVADQHLEMSEVLQLLMKMNELGIEVIKTENLYEFDGVQGFSSGQGQ